MSLEPVALNKKVVAAVDNPPAAVNKSTLTKRCRFGILRLRPLRSTAVCTVVSSVVRARSILEAGEHPELRLRGEARHTLDITLWRGHLAPREAERAQVLAALARREPRIVAQQVERHAVAADCPAASALDAARRAHQAAKQALRGAAEAAVHGDEARGGEAREAASARRLRPRRPI